MSYPTHHIAMFEAGTQHAGLIQNARSADEATGTVLLFIEDTIDHNDAEGTARALVDLAPSSVTLPDGARLTIDPIPTQEG